MAVYDLIFTCGCLLIRLLILGNSILLNSANVVNFVYSNEMQSFAHFYNILLKTNLFLMFLNVKIFVFTY